MNEEKSFELIQYVKNEGLQTIDIVYDQLSSAVRIKVPSQRTLSRTPVKIVGKLRRYNDRNAFYIQASNVIFNP